jgi:hypothetical protein
MTTIIPFLPSNLFVPTFNAVFDGATYSVTVTWNISAQRYYVNIYGADGTWIVTVPLVQTPPGRTITGVTWDSIRRVVTVQMVDPSSWPIPLSKAGLNTSPGTIVDYTLENFDPSVLNQKWRSLHINDLSFSFPLANDPGPINILGSVSRIMNMVGGIFITSTFAYRNGAFEVTP